jgi:hypothetical protein
MLTPLVTLETAGRRPLIHRSHSAPAGSVRVELQDAAGTPLAGFTAADCPEIIGDEIERVVRGKAGPGVGSFAGTPVRLRFILADADVFSFRFR